MSYNRNYELVCETICTGRHQMGLLLYRNFEISFIETFSVTLQKIMKSHL